MKYLTPMIIVVLTFVGTVHSVLAQSTAWTYQGRLIDDATEANGQFDMTFGLFISDTGGTSVSTVTNLSVSVSDGLFTTSLDFGAAVFDGTDYWLEIGLRPNGALIDFEILVPRQPIARTPYALKADNAMTVNMGSIINPGFLGTTNSAPLLLSVNNVTALRLESTGGTPNLVGGDPSNMAASGSQGVVIAGGGGLGSANTVGDGSDGSAIGGGRSNTIGNNAPNSTIPGGESNSIADSASHAFAAGQQARAEHSGSFVWADAQSAPFSSTTNNQFSVRATGGVRLSTSGAETSVEGNILLSKPAQNGALIISPSTAGAGIDPELVMQSAETGGGNNAAFHISRNAFFQTSNDAYYYIDVSGNEASKIEFDADGDIKFSSATNGTGQVFFTDNMIIQRDGKVGIGNTSPGTQLDLSGDLRINDGTAQAGYVLTSVDASGLALWQPSDDQDWAVNGNDLYRATGNVGIGTSTPNFELEVAGTIRASLYQGGEDTFLSGDNAFIGGGLANTNSGNLSGILSGRENVIEGSRNVIGSGRYNFIGNGADNGILSGQGNLILQNGSGRGFNSVIGGGRTNVCSQNFAVIGGGRLNVVTNNDSDQIFFCTIGGGDGNFSAACTGTIAGGWNNTNVSGFAPTVGGGRDNVADGNYTTVAGGRNNSALAIYATIPGGRDNEASGDYSFAAGRRAKAVNNGAFVWSDNANADLTSTANNQFLARASGGFTFLTDSGGTTGAVLPSGGGAWSNLSDRNAKEEIEPLDTGEVLRKLSQISISTWKYKAEEGGVRHAGPMAQDFHAAFGLGMDDKHISTIDADGVALAAIQGLNQKLEEKEARISALEATVAELKELISQLAKP